MKLTRYIFLAPVRINQPEGREYCLAYIDGLDHTGSLASGPSAWLLPKTISD
jgi:hypothetical protein